MIKVWSEWDIGHEHKVFRTKKAALEWCEKNPHLKEIMEETAEYDAEDQWNEVSDIIEAGLLGFEEMELEE